MIVLHVVGLFLVGHKSGNAFEQKIKIIRANESIRGELIGIPCFEWRHQFLRYADHVLAPT